MKKTVQLRISADHKKFLFLLIQAYRLKFSHPTEDHWRIFSLKYDAVDAAELHTAIANIEFDDDSGMSNDR